MNIRRFISTFAACIFLASNGFSQTASELLEEGHEAFMDYQFEEASRLYGLAKKKAKKTDTSFFEEYDNYESQLKAAQNFLNRVEKIIIIDSITVPREGFFKHYKLPSSSGMLGDAKALPFQIEGIEYVFSNEGDDYKIWSQPDSIGKMQLVESNLLTDGKWSTPTPLDETLAEDADAIFPFMMSDGVTLYYADNGENSIGGYDIMVATRDASDGTFLQPSNLGFPYNSPFDDYMLAIDELNGVGWWATDRNQLEDEITIYVFLKNDMRQNYSPDEENLIEFARISDYIATQPEDSNYDDLLATIRSIDPTARVKKAEFTIPAPGGKVYHRFDELPDNKSRAAMKQYLSAKDELEKAQSELNNLRKRYSEYSSDSLASRIRKEETAIQQQRDKVENLRKEMYKYL